MKKQIITASAIIFIVLLIGASAVYLYYHSKPASQNVNSQQLEYLRGNRTFARSNFQLNQTQIEQVTAFFNSTNDQNAINTYCISNRAYCFYYCRNISQTNEYCKNLSNMNFTRMQNRTFASQ